MHKNILSNPEQYPTVELIHACIGESQNLWHTLFDHIHAEYPGFSEEWRFYKDGKRWLMKVTQKKKTIFWLSVIENAFVVTFYFGDKAESTILESPLSYELKDSFKNGKRFGKIRGVTIDIHDDKDIQSIQTLIAIKLSLK